MLVCGNVNIRTTNEAEVLIVISVVMGMLTSCCTMADA
jgi:hypothetical protein